MSIKKLLLVTSVILAMMMTIASATSSSAVSYEEKTVNGISMKVVIVNQFDPTIGTKVTLSDDTIGETASFSSIVAEENAIVSINGNFFESYTNQVPIGNVMDNGEMLTSSAGLPNIGISDTGELLFGMPGYFIRLTTIPRTVTEVAQSFNAYDVNIVGQGDYVSRIYTPAMGASVSITHAGTVYRFADDVYQGSQAVSVGGNVTIPENGFVLYQGSAVPSYERPTDPSSLIGASVATTYRLYNPDEETASEFQNQSITALMAGNTRLVENGSTAAAATVYGDSNLTDSRWTGAAARTAIGELTDGRMIIVSTPSATLTGLAEAMVSLGCYNAINIDGGGSVSMAIDGTVVASPSRELAVTFHVYDKTTTVTEEANSTAFEPRYTVVAQALSTLGEDGLMRPYADGGFQLDRAPTRAEAATMMVRVLGAEEEALSANYAHPFTDVASWADPYVGYMYEKGLSNGISATEFGSDQLATQQMYITYLLRALGYSDAAGGDFTYAEAVTYAQYYFALTPSATYYEWEDRQFLRDDMAILTYRALSIGCKGTGKTLAATLVEQGAFTAAQATAIELKLS